MATSTGVHTSLARRAAAPGTLEMPGEHLGLTWRRLGAADADAVLDLVARASAVDRPTSVPSPAQVADALDPSRTTVMDSLGGFADGEGDEPVLDAVGVVYLPSGDTGVVRAFLTGTVAPTRRRRGIGAALLGWQVGRARQLLAADGRELPGRIAVYVDEHLDDRRHLVTRAGFRPKRVFQEMRRPVADPLPEPPALGAGLRIVNWSPDLDEDVRHAHNEAFADHWGSEPMRHESWRRINRELEPRWSKVALARTADGSEEVAGYAMTSRHEHTWPQLGFTEGYTELLGVRRAYRGRGIARALLVSVVEALREDGIDSAALDVDTINPSGAHHFYERLGYRREGAQTLYTIEI